MRYSIASTYPSGSVYSPNQPIDNSIPVTETVETKPVVAAPVAVVGKPTAPSAFKYDKLNPEGLSYDDAYAQWQAQKEQYDADLANWQSTSTDPEAIDWRTNDYRNKYSYLTDANGKPLDGYIFSGLADGSMTPDSFATYKTDWAKKQLANKDWSGYDEALKNKYIQDVADGKIKPPPPPAPTPEPEPEPITPVEEQSYNPKTGLLNSVNVGATNADGSLNVTSDKLTDEQKQAMIDGTPTTLGVDKNGKPVIGTWIKNADGTASFVANGLRLRTISKDEFDKSKITAQTAGNVTTKVADKADVERIPGIQIGETVVYGADGKPLVDPVTGRIVTKKVIENPTDIKATSDNGMLIADKVAALSKAFSPSDPLYMSESAIRLIADGIKSGEINVNDPRLYAYKGVKSISDALKSTLIDEKDANAYAASKVSDVVKNTKTQDVLISPDSLVSNRMAGLLSKNNPYIQQARNAANLQSSRRGMLNSGAAAGYAQDSAIKAAYQIAKDDAQIYADAQKANALAANNNTTTGMQLNANALVNDAKTYADAIAKNAAAQQDIDKLKAQLEAHAQEYDAGTYATISQKIADMQTSVNEKAAELKANAINNDRERSLKIATTNNTNNINALATDAKMTQEQANTQFAADNRREEVQYQGDNGNFQFNAGAQNTANNAYTNSVNAAYQSTADNEVKTNLFNVDQVNGIAQFSAEKYLAWLSGNYATMNDEQKAKYDSVNDFIKTNTVIKSEVQKAINSQVFTEINSKNAESNTLQRLLTSGNIELAQTAAKNYFDKAMASDKFEKDVMLEKLRHSYDLEKIQITNNFDWNKFQIEVLAKKEIAQADREAQVASAFAGDVLKEIGAIDRMPDITAEAKTEAKNQYIAFGAGIINYLSDSGSLGLANLITPEVPKATTSTATDNKGMLAVNWND